MAHSRSTRPQNGNRRRPEEVRHEDRIRELDAEGEPVSLAEEIAEEQARRGETSGDRYERVKQGEIHIAELQKLNMSQLIEEARKENVKEAAGMKKQDLIFNILKERVKMNGLMYGEGTLEILPDGFGFLRSPDYHYLSCPDDIYVSPSQIRRFGLRTGSTVAGQIRPPKENERYFALLRVEAVNYQDPNLMSTRVHFDDLTPLHPTQRIVMEYDPKDIATRVVDMVTPIGFGQRGLIVSPPRAGKTILMQKMAKAALAKFPDCYVIMLLIDERPEEVTDMEREVKGPNCEVISSTFDEPPSRHVQVSQMVIEKAKRMVECGTDVIIFLDSITRLARAWNSECPQSGKILSGGLDANALQRPKGFFGSARKVEEGGSLTILATALIDTGSKMDEVIFEEFKGTGNLEIVLDRRLVDKRVWPAIDINRSGTRREEMLMDPEEYRRVCIMRRVLAEMNPPEAMELLVNRLEKTGTNAEFLMSMNMKCATPYHYRQAKTHFRVGRSVPCPASPFQTWNFDVPNIIQGQRSDSATQRFAIVVSRYNQSITGNLLDGALETLTEAGVLADAIDVAWVPGAWEIPVVAAQFARCGKYAAVLCLGAVIRGETTHDEHINRQVSLSLGNLALECDLPVIFGLLTCNSLEQAINRSGGTVGNKGIECAEAALEMVSLLSKLRSEV